MQILDQLLGRLEFFTQRADFIPELRRRSQQAFRERLQPIEGATEVVRRLRLPSCVASGGPRRKIELTLGLIGLLPDRALAPIFGLNMTTGAKDKAFPPTVKASWFHHRCYRAKATDKYILCSRSGIEFIDLKTGEWTINHWVRGGCLYGIMPCNGLIYAPFNPCACFPEAKMNGFSALSAASKSRAVPKDIPVDGRLEKGPAFGKVSGSKSAPWPTYRHDAARSGSTRTAPPLSLKTLWTATVKGEPTACIIGEGKVLLASKRTRRLHAFDEKTGARLWSKTMDGPMDSPPTIYRGAALCGGRDGWVTCLRLADGEVGTTGRCDTCRAPGSGRATEGEETAQAGGATPVRLLLPGGRGRRSVDYGAAISLGAGAAANIAMRLSWRKLNTCRPCLRSVGVTVIMRSTNRSPRSLWVPKHRRRHMTSRRNSRSAW